mmetsp:Transcript_23217/g.58655  ORF Transcript_23217/g.58655 Transcript_23217/m.58655 type:complete len:220 (+) Transcript_23217:1639-2298(+)
MFLCVQHVVQFCALVVQPRLEPFYQLVRVRVTAERPAAVRVAALGEDLQQRGVRLALVDDVQVPQQHVRAAVVISIPFRRRTRFFIFQVLHMEPVKVDDLAQLQNVLHAGLGFAQVAPVVRVQVEDAETELGEVHTLHASAHDALHAAGGLERDRERVRGLVLGEEKQPIPEAAVRTEEPPQTRKIRRLVRAENFGLRKRRERNSNPMMIVHVQHVGGR